MRTKFQKAAGVKTTSSQRVEMLRPVVWIQLAGSNPYLLEPLVPRPRGSG